MPNERQFKVRKGRWKVQTGRGKDSYRKTWIFPTFYQAWAYYYGLNVHSGYKKRLIHVNRNGSSVIDRVITK